MPGPAVEYVHIIKSYDSARLAATGRGARAFHSLRSSPSFFTRLSPSGLHDGRRGEGGGEVYYGAVDAYSDSGWAAAGGSSVAAAAVGLAVVTFHTTLFLGDDDDGRSDFGPLCPGPPLLSPAFRLLTQLLIALLGTPVFQEWRIFASSPTPIHET